MLTDDGRHPFATVAQSNSSSYTVDDTDRLTLLKGDAARTDELPAVGPTVLPGDLTLSRDSRYLVERHVTGGHIHSCPVGKAAGSPWCGAWSTPCPPAPSSSSAPEQP